VSSGKNVAGGALNHDPDEDRGDDLQQVAISTSQRAGPVKKLIVYIELHPKAFGLGLLNAVHTIRRKLNEKSLALKGN
jgi:hypothetical protein